MAMLERHARTFFLLSRPSRYTRRSRIPFYKRQESLCQGFATSRFRAQEKPYYVTSPIFYVNASPHVGHLYTLVITDILKRWHVLRGDEKATMLTGTDEHGMKIQKAAQQAGTDVKLFCDTNMKQFAQLCQKADISHDYFIRTTDPDHKAAVEHFWQELNHRGWIYESKHEGWYSVSDETFFPQSAVHLVREPSSGRKVMVSMETGKEVEWASEVNYHFKLSAFRDRLLKHYEENLTFVVPEVRMKNVIKDVTEGLQDLSISRPVERLTWGVRVPNDESQTIYVWLDALINYLTYTGYPFSTRPSGDSIWPPNCQVVGKDIAKFHCIYWPAFLMALDLPLPKQILTHAHWTMNRAKMSKSTGNVVNPFFAIDRFDVDTMRFYMAHDGGIIDDADYENAYIIDRYKKSLQGGLGNLVSRIVRGRKWSVQESVLLAESEDIDQLLALNRVHCELIMHTPEVVAQQMNELNPRAALRTIMDLIYSTNKFLHHTQVWDMVKDEDREVQLKVQRLIYICSESIRVAAILLQPFMPSKLKTCLDLLGVEESMRTFDHAAFRADFTYGSPAIEIGKAGTAGTLFPPLVAEW